MNYFMYGIKKYADFKGRARRTEFFMYLICFSALSVPISVISVLLSELSICFIFLPILYILVMIIPLLAVAVRRLHDTGRSGAWFFIGFLPLVGGLIYFMFICTDSTPGSNQYGVDPKARETR